jgi:hypothetical protein
MTLKHIEFTDSEVLRELERLAADKGDYAETDLIKTASATVENYEPTDDLFNDVIRLASGLRTRGLDKQADELENKLFVRQSAKKKMEESKKDDGEKLLDQAHPEGDVEISPSSSGLGKVWTEQSAKKEILKVVQKTPTGKLAERMENIIKAASDALGLEKKAQVVTMPNKQTVSQKLRAVVRALEGTANVDDLEAWGEGWVGSAAEINGVTHKITTPIFKFLELKAKEGYDPNEMLDLIVKQMMPQTHTFQGGSSHMWWNTSSKVLDVGRLWSDGLANGRIPLVSLHSYNKKKKSAPKKKKVALKKLWMHEAPKLQSAYELFNRLYNKFDGNDDTKAGVYGSRATVIYNHLKAFKEWIKSDDAVKQSKILSARALARHITAQLLSKLSECESCGDPPAAKTAKDILTWAKSHAEAAGLSTDAGAQNRLVKTALDKAKKDEINALRRELKTTLKGKEDTEAYKAKLRQLNALEKTYPAEAGSFITPSGGGAAPKKPGAGSGKGGRPGAGYKQGSVAGMQRALHGFSDALKKQNRSEAERVGKTGKSGRAVDNDWGTETDLALQEAEKMRKKVFDKRVKATHVEIKTKAQGGNAASNTASLKALTEYFGGEGPVTEEKKGKPLGTYKTKSGTDVHVATSDVTDLRSFLNMLQDQGVYVEFKAGGATELASDKPKAKEPQAKEGPKEEIVGKHKIPAEASRKTELRKLAQVITYYVKKNPKTGKNEYVDPKTPGAQTYSYNWQTKQWTQPEQTQPQAQNELGEGAGYTYNEWLETLKYFYGKSTARLKGEAGDKRKERLFQAYLRQLHAELDELAKAKKVVPGSAAAQTVVLVPGGAGGGLGGKRRKGRPGADDLGEGKGHEIPEDSMNPPILPDLDLATSRWNMPEKWQLDINLTDWNTSHATDLASQHFSDVDDVASLKSAELKYMKGQNNIQNYGWNDGAQTHNVRHWTKNPNATRAGYTPYQRPNPYSPGNMMVSGYYKDVTLQALLGAKYMDYMQTSSKAGAGREMQKFILTLRKKLSTVRKEYLQEIKGTDRYAQLRKVTKRYHSRWNEVLGRKYKQITQAIHSGDIG